MAAGPTLSNTSPVSIRNKSRIGSFCENITPLLSETLCEEAVFDEIRHFPLLDLKIQDFRFDASFNFVEFRVLRAYFPTTWELSVD